MGSINDHSSTRKPCGEHFFSRSDMTTLNKRLADSPTLEKHINGVTEIELDVTRIFFQCCVSSYQNLK